MKKLFFLLSLLAVLSSTSVRAQIVNTAQANVLVVRLVETEYPGHILIANGQEKPLKISFTRDDKKLSSEEVTLLGIQKVLADLYQQGYVLQSTLSGIQLPSEPDKWRYSTMIFVRKP